jgi:diguanylate cyclase (GGDEF)-like protein/PAS domain S-box-containing protein
MPRLSSNPLAAIGPRAGVRAALAATRAELELAEQRYRQLVEQIPAIVYECEFDADATLRYVSPQVEALLGHPPQAYLDDPGLWYRQIHPDDVERVREREQVALISGGEFDCEYRVRTADGRQRHVWERDSVVRDEAGTAMFTQGIVVDVTPLREAELAVRAQRDQAKAYLDAASGIFLVLRPDGRIGVLNAAGHITLGYEAGELIGRDWFALALPPEDRERQRDGFERVISGQRDGPYASYENTVQCRDGRRRTFAWHTTVTRGPDGLPTAMLCSGTDVSEHREAERKVAYLDYHDHVTGLPNRALLEEHLELALARARRREGSVALLCLGLEDFKLVNDSLGHAAGDELLRAIALRLDERLRADDMLVRRESAEFMVMLGDLDAQAEEAARAAAEALRDALAEPFTLAATEFHLDATIGIALFPADAADTAELMRHADLAMQESKTYGRNGIAVFSGDGQEPLDRLSLSTRLRRAIDGGELVLHWQPIVDPTTGVLRRAEALVRWQDPDRGLVAPADFIPFAESTGLIERIGEWVSENVFRQCAQWSAMGLDPEVAFNVSARELRRSGYAARLLERLRRHGVDPRRVIVEVTESAAMSEDGASDAALHELTAAHLNVAIDDFGAGWSSLGRLRDLPVRMLKIDRSFLRGVPEDPQASAVVQAILELASALGMETVAEGVETAEQRAFLVDRDCPLAQGYLLDRPMPATAMEVQLRSALAARSTRAA